MAEKEDAMDIAKAAIEEAKALKEELEIVKMENAELRNAVEDPTEMMKAHGWQRYVTPHAEETFDPLNRQVPLDSTPFSGSGDLFLKSRDEQLREWEEAERQVKA